MAQLLFPESFLQQLVLHAQIGEHLLRPSALILKRLGLRNHGPIHTAIFGAPFNGMDVSPLNGKVIGATICEAVRQASEERTQRR